MCLAIPGKVLSIKENTAEVDLDGILLKANISLVPEIKVGEYCLIHAGFAIEQIDEDYALETRKYLKELRDGDHEIK
jgi:hydrogenase expression/formation protein HypC